jgi:RND family efflux transporter MFP subunit
MRRNLILTLGVMMATGLLMAGCKAKKPVTEQADTRVEVKVATAVSEIIAQDVEFTANIEPWQKNYIIPALQGARINRIYVNVGDRVGKGQLVAEMDPTQYNTAKVQFETAEADYNRIKKVYQAGGISEQTLRQAEAQYLVYKEALDNLAKNVKLYSPIDGVVTQKPEEEGNLFTSTPILEIMQMDRLKVKVNISEQYFAKIQVGTPVSISVDLYPGEMFPASVSLVYPAIDATTRTFAAEVTIPSAEGRLRPGMFARSTINMGDKEAVMLPDTAVQKQIGTNDRFVYVIENGTAHRRPVTPGRQTGDRMDILSGLKAGEQVAVTSFSRLTDGVEVTVVE